MNTLPNNYENKNYCLIVIGGLIFNNKPLLALEKIGCNINFIDINEFNAPFSIDEVLSYVEKIILKINRKVILIGYSSGGLIAILLAQKNPSLIYKIFLINSTPSFIKSEGWNGIDIVRFNTLIKKVHALSLADFYVYFCKLASHPNLTFANSIMNWKSNFLNKDTTLNWLHILRDTDLRTELNDINFPLYFVYSKNDILVPSNNKFKNKNISQTILNSSTHIDLMHDELINIISMELK